MIFDPPPKSRRRVVARFLWPGLIAIAVVVAVLVSSAGEETRVELEYLEEIRTQTDELAQGGISIADVMARVDEVSRDEFTTVFDSVRADLDVALEFVSEDPPVDSLIPVWALYRQALQAWDAGVNGLSDAILQAADDPANVTVINATGDALASLRAGDALYLDLKAEFQREEIPEPVSPLIDVRMSPSDAGLMSQSASYVAAAQRSTASLALRPGLMVSQVVSDPDWDIDVENQAVIPATDSVVIKTVITNSGNIASEPESVMLTLEGGAEPVVASAEVPPLEPGAQTTVEFSALDVLPETLYEVTVELQLSHPDSDMTDNESVVQFTVNPS